MRADGNPVLQMGHVFPWPLGCWHLSPSAWLIRGLPSRLGPWPRAGVSGWGRGCSKLLQAAACREVVLADGVDADGGHGAEREASLEQGVQGGEGSGKQPVPLLVKQVAFFSREALPGESPAGLGWRMKQEATRANPRAGAMDWATKLGYKIWLPKLHWCFSRPRKAPEHLVWKHPWDTVSSMRDCGNG